MKGKKLVLIFDVIIVLILTMSMLRGTVTTQIGLNANEKALADNSNLSFNLIASPEETKVKAGATVEITLSAEDIKIGKEGLNSIVGHLSYDESLFDSVEIKAEQEKGWNIELNQIKDHSMYGKFCIYTMQEGVTENQNVVKIKMKLKDDLKPQTTKVYFTELASSDGEVEVPEEDRVVTIIIYEDEIPAEPKPVEPSKPVQTGDNKILVVIAVAILTIILNILIFSKNKKSKVLSTILVVMLGLSSLGMVTYAANGDINVAEVLNRLSYRQSWLNSDKYLVTAENVSRVAPGSKVETIKNIFNKEIVVTKNGEEVKDGTILGTGMKISVKNPSERDAEGNYAYELSVYGDTNGDGKSNQVELTRIIRNVVDEEKWNLTGVKKVSADLTVDNKIDEKDVNPSVKYIVYGEMSIPEFEPVEEPTIEVIDGTYDKEENCYTTNVKVKITEKAENGIKTQYKVENSKGEIVPYTEISREKTESGKYETIIELEKDEIYKVSAYTTGELGNRSGIPYIIVNGVFNNLREYRVEYYYKNLENDKKDIYVKDEEKTVTKYAEIGDTIDTYEDKNKPGYDLATEKGRNGAEGLPLKISKNKEDNVIKVYYKIHHYSIEYDPNGGEWPEGNPNPSTYTIETLPIKVKDPEKIGYEPKGWTEEEGEPPVNPYIIPTGTTGDIKITEQWEELEYNIEYTNTKNSTVVENKENPTKYKTSETPIDIYNLNDVEGFKFTGWKLINVAGENYTGTTLLSTIIEEGQRGNLIYEAQWEEVLPEPHTVTAEVVGGHGTIEPPTQEVAHGGSVSNIVITPDENYVVAVAKMYSGPKDEARQYDPVNDTDGIRLRVANKKDANGTIKVATITNVIEDKHVVVKLKERNTDVVAKIVAVPDDNEHLANLESEVDGEPILDHEYETLEDALKDAWKVNNERDTKRLKGKVKILILKDIEDETSVVDTTTDQTSKNEIVIDLDGYTISAEDVDNATIKVKLGASLQIIDGSKEQTGTIKNTEGLAIKVDNGAELTLGEDAEGQEPSIESPRIEGQTNGIKYDGDGIFNFYDGLIIGNTGAAVNGKTTVDATPEHYTAYTQQDPDDSSKSIEYLVVPVDVVAMIGSNTYETLEEAFAKADSMDNTNPIEIDLIRSTTLSAQARENIITIAKDRNYILDLNGNTISNDEYWECFINKGNFTIKDSTAINKEENKLSELQHDKNSNYYFEQVGNTLRMKTANNAEINSETIYHSFAEVDLTKVSASETKILDISAYVNKKGLKFVITEDKTMPDNYNSIQNVLDSTTQTYRFELEGGKKYYLHILGKNNETINSSVVTDIRLASKPLIKELSSTNGRIVNSTYIIQNLKDANLTIKNVYLDGKNEGVLNYGNVTIEDGIIEGCIANNENIIHSNHELGNPASIEIKNSVIESILSYARNINPTKIKITDDTFIFNSVSASEGEIIDCETRGDFECDKLNATNCVFGGKVTCLNGKLENVKMDKLNVSGDTTIKNSKIYFKGSYPGDIEGLNIEGGKITIEDSSVESIKSYGIVDCINSNTADIETYNVFTMHSGTISGDVYVGVRTTEENVTAGKFYMYDGIIKGSITTYSSVDDNDTEVVLGRKNDGSETEISTETPKIEYVGSDDGYAINCVAGKLKIYDGQIIANKGYGISASDVELEEGTSLYIEELPEDKEKITLIVNKQVARIAKSSGITIPSGINKTEDSEYYIFFNLNDAIACCPENANNTTTIEIMDTLLITNQSHISSNKNIKIDLKGFNLRYLTEEEAFLVDDGSVLMIDNSTENIGGISNEGSGDIIQNNGKSIIGNSEIKGSINNTGVFEINNTVVSGDILNTGMFEINNIEALGDILNTDNGEMIINGGNFLNKSLSNRDNATLTINDGNFDNIVNGNNATVTINGGSISDISNTNENETDDVIEVTGGTIWSLSSETKAPIKVSGIIEDGNYKTKIVNMSIKGYANIDTAVIGETYEAGLQITDNYATINNSNIKGTIVNTTENTTTISNSYLPTFTLDGTGKTIISDCTIGSGTSGDDLTNKGSSDLEIQYTEGTSKVFRRINNYDNAKLTIKNGVSSYALIYSTSTNDVILINTKPSINNNQYGTLEIRNENSGNIYIDDDCVIKGDPAIENKGAGNVYIGDEDSTLSIEKPMISSDSCAVKNTGSGKIVFNNGIIIGANTGAISGEIEPREGYSITDYNEYEDSTKQAKILTEQLAIASIEQSQADVSGIESDKYKLRDGNYEFKDLTYAVQACKSNATIKIITEAQISSSASTVEIESDDEITIDLNGNKLTVNKENYITNNGNLTITDSSESNTGRIIATKAGLLTNNKTLDINDVIIEINTGEEEENVKTIITNNTNATCNITSGAEIYCPKSYVTIINNKGTFEIANSKINGTQENITLIENEGSLSVENSILNNNNRATRTPYKPEGTDISIKNIGDITLNTTTMFRTRIVNNDEGTIEMTDSIMTGCIINNSTKVKTDTSKAAVEIIGSYINASIPFSASLDYYFLTTNNAGQMIFKNSTNKTVQFSTVKHDNGTSANFTNNGGIITIESGIIAEDLINNAGTIEILGGEVSGIITNKEGATLKILGGTLNNIVKRFDSVASIADGVSDVVQYIGKIQNSGTLIIGDKANAVNKEIPEINYPNGTIINDEKTAVFNYYDGKITINEELNGIINETSENVSIIHKIEGSTHIYQISTDTVIAKVNQEPCYTLEDAFSKCRDNNADTIIMQETIALPEGSSYEIGENKNIILDLNNKNIKVMSKTTLFTNNGIFEITDSSIENGGLLNGYCDVLITNQNTFKLTGGEITILGFENHEEKIVVLNNQTGSVEMTGGTIRVSGLLKNNQKYYGYAIKGDSEQTNKLLGGKIICSDEGLFIGIQRNTLNTTTINNIIIEDNFIVEKDTSSNISSSSIINGSVTNKNLNIVMSGGQINHKFYIENCNFDMTGGMIDTLISYNTSGKITIDGPDVYIKSALATCDINIYSGKIDSLGTSKNTNINSEEGNNPTESVNIGSYSNSGLCKMENASIGKYSASKSTDIIKNTNIQNMNIYNNADVTIGDGVKIEGPEIAKGCGTVYVQSGSKLNLNGTDVSITSTDGIGLLIKGSFQKDVEVILGSDDDKTISKTSPIISGKLGGIDLQSFATLKWNDGVAICTDETNDKAAFTGNLTKLIVPERVQGYYGVRTENNNKKAYIGPNIAVEIVAYIGDTGYRTLSEAVQYIKNTSSTQPINISSTIVLEEQLEIPEGCNITIDLQGYGIGVSNTEPLIKINSGATLTINDSSAEQLGVIENRIGVAIENNGTLNVNINRDKIISGSTENAIEGSGTTNYNE